MRKRQQAGTELIAGFKIAKGLVLLTVSLGLLPLIHADIATFFSRLFEELRLNADSRILHSLILSIDALQPHDVLMASLVGLAFSAILLTEGMGLHFHMSWAAYMAVVSTSLFIPFEIFELLEEVSGTRVLLLIVNVVIVWYLITQLKHHTFRTTVVPSEPVAQAESVEWRRNQIDE